MLMGYLTIGLTMLNLGTYEVEDDRINDEDGDDDCLDCRRSLLKMKEVNQG